MRILAYHDIFMSYEDDWWRVLIEKETEIVTLLEERIIFKYLTCWYIQAIVGTYLQESIPSREKHRPTWLASA